MADGSEGEHGSDEVGEGELCLVESVEIEGIGATATSGYAGTTESAADVDGEPKGPCSALDHDESSPVDTWAGRSGA